MTGAQVAEKEVPGSKADMLHRGRNVALAFTMQVCLLSQSINQTYRQYVKHTKNQSISQSSSRSIRQLSSSAAKLLVTCISDVLTRVCTTT